MNFLQKTPFFRLLLALIAGIILFQIFHIPAALLWAILFLSVTLLILSFLIKSSDKIYQFRWIFGVGSSLSLLVIGYWLCLNFQNKNTFSALNEKNTFLAELTSSPVEKANSYQCKIRLLEKIDSLHVEKAKGNAIIYLQKDSSVSSLHLGDKLLIYAEFKTPDGIENPQGFDYAKYLRRQGILATAYISSDNWQKTTQKPDFTVFYLSDQIRNHLLNVYKSHNISGDEYAVLSALTLGYTDSLQPDLRKNYSAAGAMHILAISGLHVGIVYMVLSFLLGFMDKRRKSQIVKAVFIIVFLWIYAFVTGLSPAVIRAALMFSFVAFAGVLERKSQIYNTIFMSAFLMLLFKPNLLFEVGFQLSYSAVLSIVYFQPKISKWIYTKNKLAKWSWNLAAVSLAAQIGTAPFALYYFHQFSNYFLLTNFVAIPLATGIIYLAIALLVTSFLPILPNIIAYLLNGLLKLLNFSIEKIQELPHSISNVSLDYVQLIFVFTALLLIFAYFHYKKYILLALGLCSFLIVTSMFAVQKYKTLHSDKLIVFSDSRIPIINFIHQGENFVFTTDSAHAEKTIESFWKSNLLQKPIFIKENQWFSDGFCSFQNKIIYVVTDNSLKNKTSEMPLNIDFLIISNKAKPKIESILSCVQPKAIIVDKSISAWYTNHIKEVCNSSKIKYYSVAENGAFVLNFSE